jgi:hypothetical protein
MSDDHTILLQVLPPLLPSLQHTPGSYIIGSPVQPSITLYRYKREAYRGSEFAPRILAENGIKVVLKVCPPFQATSLLIFCRATIQSQIPDSYCSRHSRRITMACLRILHWVL